MRKLLLTQVGDTCPTEATNTENETSYRSVVELSPNAIIVHHNGVIIYVNPATVKMFAASSEQDILGKNIIDLVHVDFRQIVAQRVESVLTDDVTAPMMEMKFVRIDDTVIDVESQGTPIIYKGLKAVHVALRDITQLRKTKDELENTLIRLRKSLAGTIDVISNITDMRDPYTSSHQKSVSVLARRIAQNMGLSPDEVEEIRLAALIHDIGKMIIPAEILSKPTKLKPAEFELIKEHAQSGFNALEKTELSEVIKQTVLQHHERLDGSGYPQGLKDGEILLEARILSVADVVDAMISHRPYRPSLGVDAALVEIMKNKSILYDPVVVDTCFKILIEDKKIII